MLKWRKMKRLIFLLIITAILSPLTAEENMGYKGFTLGTDRETSDNLIKKSYSSFSTEETKGSGGEVNLALKSEGKEGSDSLITLTFTSKKRLCRIDVKTNMSYKKINSFQKKLVRIYGEKMKSGEYSNIETSFLDGSFQCSKSGNAVSSGRLLSCYYSNRGIQLCRALYGTCFLITVKKRYYIEVIKQNRGIKQIILEDRILREKEKKKPIYFDFKEFD